MPRDDVEGLLDLLSVPRPNGSRALGRTARALGALLEGAGIPWREERFRAAAYFNELMGLWLILSGAALLVAVLARSGWIALGIALLLVLVPVLETGRLIPVVTGLLRVPASNLILEVPADAPRRRVVVAAHYDSKTELLDHPRRLWLLRRAHKAMGLALLAGLAALADAALQAAGSAWAGAPFAVAVVSSGVVALFGGVLGGNLLLGRWRKHPSQGAVDNGAAVAAVVELCGRMTRGELALRHVAVTGCLFTGEEVQMQGARHFVARWTGEAPWGVVNLEAIGQDGRYGIWEADGTVLTRLPLDPALTDSLEAAVLRVTGEESLRLPTINSDALPFLGAGIPTAVLSTLDRRHGLMGLHSPLDRRERVHGAKVLECVSILEDWLREVDRDAGDAGAPGGTQSAHRPLGSVGACRPGAAEGPPPRFGSSSWTTCLRVRTGIPMVWWTPGV